MSEKKYTIRFLDVPKEPNGRWPDIHITPITTAQSKAIHGVRLVICVAKDLMAVWTFSNGAAIFASAYTIRFLDVPKEPNGLREALHAKNPLTHSSKKLSIEEAVHHLLVLDHATYMDHHHHYFLVLSVPLPRV